MKKILLLVIAPGLLSSCIMIQSVSISDVKPSSGRQIEASAAGVGVLGLTAPKNIGEKATNKLKNKQLVENVNTVLTMRNWLIIQYYKVTATGTTVDK